MPPLPSDVATWKQQQLIRAFIAQKKRLLELLGREPSVPMPLKGSVMTTASWRNVRSTQLIFTLHLTDFTVVKTEIPTLLLKISVFLKTLYPQTPITTFTVTMCRDRLTRLVMTPFSAVTLSVWLIGEILSLGLVL